MENDIDLEQVAKEIYEKYFSHLASLQSPSGCDVYYLDDLDRVMYEYVPSKNLYWVDLDYISIIVKEYKEYVADPYILGWGHWEDFICLLLNKHSLHETLHCIFILPFAFIDSIDSIYQTPEYEIFVRNHKLDSILEEN